VLGDSLNRKLDHMSKYIKAFYRQETDFRVDAAFPHEHCSVTHKTHTIIIQTLILGRWGAGFSEN